MEILTSGILTADALNSYGRTEQKEVISYASPFIEDTDQCRANNDSTVQPDNSLVEDLK